MKKLYSNGIVRRIVFHGAKRGATAVLGICETIVRILGGYIISF